MYYMNLSPSLAARLPVYFKIAAPVEHGREIRVCQLDNLPPHSVERLAENIPTPLFSTHLFRFAGPESDSEQPI